MNKALRRALIAAIFFISLFQGRADLVMNFDFWAQPDGSGGMLYFAFPSLSSTNTVVTYHRIESPTDKMSATFGPTNTGSSAWVFTLEELLAEMTNGLWKVYMNRELPSEQVYYLKIALSGLTAERLGNLNMTYPLDGEEGVPPRPVFTWSFSSNPAFQSIYVETGAQNEVLPPSATSWSPPADLPLGINNFSLRYFTPYYGMSATTPTNSNGTQLTGWSVGEVSIFCSAEVAFNVTPSATGLNEAIEWLVSPVTTLGIGQWTPQNVITHDGEDAARSAPINDREATSMQTTAPNNGTVTFFWKVSSEHGDRLNFYINGVRMEWIDDEVDWTEVTYPVQAGDVLTWQYAKDFLFSSGEDAGFVDNVTFASDTLMILQFGLQRDASQNRPQGGYYFFPGLYYSYPAPEDTVHRVQSPLGFFSAEVGTNNGISSYTMNTLGDLLNEVTNGLWTLTMFKDMTNEEVFYFAVGLTNLPALPAAAILAPLNGAKNVSQSPLYRWSGPSSYSRVDIWVQSQFVQNLPASTTSWTGPTLPKGHHDLEVNYVLDNFAGFYATMPTNSSGLPLLALAQWYLEPSYLQTSDRSSFTVGLPNPVVLQNASVVGTNFTFTFQSQAGFTHQVQSRTNLASGVWNVVTNIPGSGSIIPVSVRRGTSRQFFVRILSQ